MRSYSTPWLRGETEAQMQRLIPHLDQMIEGGLIATSKVDVIRYSRSKPDSPVAG
jgi:hypothetical protein